MKLGQRETQELPLMAEEVVQLSFGEKRGLQAGVGTDRHMMVLTNQRLLRVSRAGRNLDVTFLSLEDARVAEVRHTSRGVAPLLRVALLAAGAATALVTIDYSPLAFALAIALGLGGGYHLLRYLAVSQEGSVLFRTGQEEVGISFTGAKAHEAHTFINRFFQLKADASSPPKEGQGRQTEPEALTAETLHTEHWTRENQGAYEEPETPKEEALQLEYGPRQEELGWTFLRHREDGMPRGTPEQVSPQEEPTRSRDEGDALV